MIKIGTKAFGLALAIGAFSLMAGASSASASSYLVGGTALQLANNNSTQLDVHLVGQRRAHRSRRRVNRNRRAHRRGYRQGRRHAQRYNGRRYRHRRHGYNRYYNGYWYPHAWWLGAAAIGTAIAVQPRQRYSDGGDEHVRWCLGRYRSYSPRTDMFLAYSGRYKPCISPFSY